jgi:hypothetical protein
VVVIVQQMLTLTEYVMTLMTALVNSMSVVYAMATELFTIVDVQISQ